VSSISDTESVEGDRQREPVSRLKSFFAIAATIAIAAFLLGLTYMPDAVQAFNGH